MTENAFRPGDQVIARFDGDGGWYKAVIERLETDGNYTVRWAWTRDKRPPSKSTKTIVRRAEDGVDVATYAPVPNFNEPRPTFSMVDPDDIRRA